MPSSAFEFFRHAVLPSVRPAGVDQTASVDAPEEGITSITGTGGGVIDLAFSSNQSWSRQLESEEERTFDVVRTYHVDVGGAGGAASRDAVDKSKYVEWEAVREVTFANGAKVSYAAPKISDNMELMEEGVTRKA